MRSNKSGVLLLLPLIAGLGIVLSGVYVTSIRYESLPYRLGDVHDAEARQRLVHEVLIGEAWVKNLSVNRVPDETLYVDFTERLTGRAEEEQRYVLQFLVRWGRDFCGTLQFVEVNYPTGETRRLSVGELEVRQ